MDQKTIAWVSYLTLIGWIIALVTYSSSTDKSSLVKFHLRQSFGLMVLAIIFWVLRVMFLFTFLDLGFFGFLSLIFTLIGLGLLVLWILGLVGAANGEEKEIPVIGALSQKMFTFIN